MVRLHRRAAVHALLLPAGGAGAGRPGGDGRATFETDPPLWLVIYYNREFGPPYDARVAEIFERDYEFVDARGQYQLLRHREGA